MSFLSGLIEWGIDLIIAIIAATGYGGIILLMAAESACIPIPSEVIMPLSGYLAWKGTLSLIGVILAGALGSMLGSLVAYYAGLRLGRPFIVRYGRYILLKESDLDTAERWFAKYGGKATFIARLVPIVRTFISLPAGIAKMDIKRFTVYSFVGSVPWCAFLAYVGYVLEDSWRVVFDRYGHYVDLAVVVGVVVLISYIVWAHRKRVNRGAAGPSAKDE
jgi:membrane protein DedA with SNARE-associated domain